MVIDINMKHYKGKGILKWTTYYNKRTCIVLESLIDGPICKATVNIPEAILAEEEVLIKDWSENEGILAILVAAGVVLDTGRRVASCSVKANVCRLLVQPK